MNSYQGIMQPFPGLAQWSRQVKLRSSQIDLFAYDTGEDGKTPLVLLHGLGDEADTWRHVYPLLQADFRVIAPDLPGFGRSQKVRRSYTLSFFVETVCDLLDTLSLSSVALVGHSNGAIIAQALALDHPERVERLVLISGSLVSRENRINLGLLLFLIPGVGEWLYTRLRKNPQAAYETLAPYYHHFEGLPQADRDFLFQRVNERVWSDGQRRAFFSTLRNLAPALAARQKGLAERLRACEIPTTVVWGGNDRINTPEGARALAEMLPSARLVMVPAAGHNLQQEQPEAVAKAIRESRAGMG